jgi:hypothetical protein
MDTIDLLSIRQWFSNYCRKFYSEEKEEQKNISLKELHSRNVSANMLSIAGAMLQNRDRILIAEAIGLLHDLGRFPQYARYKTFRDGISVNHGTLGAEVIVEENTVGRLPLHEQEVIIDAVKFHNVFAVPGNLDPDRTFFLKMVRDADKIDIWRVFAEFFEKGDEERESAAGLDLPDSPHYSEQVLACLSEKRLATLANLRTQNDFKIMQLTWVYDLNFPASFRLAVERGMIDRIISTLPESADFAPALSILRQYMRDRAAG